jgi:hypothetical protein
MTQYYLSTDTTKSIGDKLLTGTRSVPTLGPGASSTGTLTVTVPTTTTLGTYYLLACADDAGILRVAVLTLADFRDVDSYGAFHLT